jgi:hypothetical protein
MALIEGTSSPKDDREAARLHNLAAGEGNAAGQAYLGKSGPRRPAEGRPRNKGTRFTGKP